MARHKISNKAFLDAVSRYQKRFDMWLYISPENASTDEKREECISLINKSCETGEDFVAPRYGLDYEEQHRKFDIIYD